MARCFQYLELSPCLVTAFCQLQLLSEAIHDHTSMHDVMCTHRLLDSSFAGYLGVMFVCVA